ESGVCRKAGLPPPRRKPVLLAAEGTINVLDDCSTSASTGSLSSVKVSNLGGSAIAVAVADTTLTTYAPYYDPRSASSAYKYLRFSVPGVGRNAISAAVADAGNTGNGTVG